MAALRVENWPRSLHLLQQQGRDLQEVSEQHKQNSLSNVTITIGCAPCVAGRVSQPDRLAQLQQYLGQPQEYPNTVHATDSQHILHCARIHKCTQC